MNDANSLTTTNILATASECLIAGGYRRIEDRQASPFAGLNTRLFEDKYGIVAVIVYETWADLQSGWIKAQEALVELISRYFTSSDAKAWEGYLVLLTPSLVDIDARAEADAIRYDTSRVRKLLATGNELKEFADIERVFVPLLMLDPDLYVNDQESALDMLPQLLAQKGLPEGAVQVIIRAFSQQQPLVEQLHLYLS